MFRVDATIQTSNWGGYEIMLSDSADAIKVRDNYGQDKMEVSEWLEIEYDGNGNPVAYFGENLIDLTQAIRTNTRL